jgi:type I restriction enzyme, R subunit
VDCNALDDFGLLNRREDGGFIPLDRIFGGQLQPVIEALNDAL